MHDSIRTLNYHIVLVPDLADDEIIEVDFPDLRVPPPPNIITTSPTVNGTPKSSGEPKPKKVRTALAFCPDRNNVNHSCILP